MKVSGPQGAPTIQVFLNLLYAKQQVIRNILEALQVYELIVTYASGRKPREIALTINYSRHARDDAMDLWADKADGPRSWATWTPSGDENTLRPHGQGSCPMKST